jgi:methylthioribulose-1-phosphate dehydratase
VSGAFTDRAEAAEQLIAEGRLYYSRGWMPATAGNLSVRLAGAEQPRFLVTQSGLHKGSLGPEHLVECGPGWSKVEYTSARPSAETWIHEAIYERVAWANAVFHVHTVETTLLSLLPHDGADKGVRLLRFRGLELSKALGVWTESGETCLPVLPNWADVSQIGEDVRRSVTEDSLPAFLIAGHGLTCWGKSVEDARRHVEAVEFLAACLRGAPELMGG